MIRRFIVTTQLILMASIILGISMASGEIIQLTDNDYADYEPQIHNGLIVWTIYDASRKSTQIVYWDGTSAKQLTYDNDTQNRHPQIHNGQVVWEGNRDIFFWDGSKVLQLNVKFDWNEHRNPQIHNGQVVWQGAGQYVIGLEEDYIIPFQIFYWDGSSTIQLTDNDYDNSYPQIHNGQVVWSAGPCDELEGGIFYWDGSSTKQLIYDVT